MYRDTQLWPKNIRFIDHVSPADHRAFYSSSPLTLNITRGSMAAMGYCPSGRLFEAAACGTAVMSDNWEGLDTFFTPGEEIMIVQSTAEAIRGHHGRLRSSCAHRFPSERARAFLSHGRASRSTPDRVARSIAGREQFNLLNRLS